MKTAIVTGASGFIGRALVRELLAHDVEVAAVVRNPAAMAEFAESAGGGHYILLPAAWWIF